jgi:LPXTG-site transpeptidase (sortase) family protein
MKSHQNHTLLAKFVAACVIVILALAVLPGGTAYAGSCNSKASAAWSATTTWNAGCTGPGGIPGSGDDVTIANGNAVIFDVAYATVNSLTINGGATASSLTIAGSNALTVTGNVTVNTPTGNVTNAVNVNAGTLNVGGNLQLDASATPTRKTQLTISTGTVTVNGNITNANSTANSQVVFFGAGTLNVGGNYAGGGTFIRNTGTVNFNGAAQIIPAFAYNNLTFTGSDVKTMNTGTTIGGILTLGGTASASSVENLAVGAALVVNPRTSLTVGSNFTLTVTGASTIGGSLYLAGSGANPNPFSGDVTINDGGLWDETGAAPINFGGNFTDNGTFTANSSSSAVHTFTATKTISGANPIAMPYLTATGAVTNTGNLTVASTLAGTGTLTNGANATLNLAGITTVGTLTATAANNTVNYTGAAQSVRGTGYFNLTLTGSGVKTMNTGTSVAGNMLLSGTGVSATTAASLSITGSLQVNSGDTLATASTYTLTVGTAGKPTSTTVNGTLDLENTGTNTFYGPTTINNGGTLTLGNTGAKTFIGDLTINTSGVYNETGVAAITNSGSLANSGTYNANTGGHTFNGTTGIITGTVSIPNLTVGNSATLTNNGTLTVSTALAAGTGTPTLINAAAGTLNYGGTTAIAPTLNAGAAGNTVNYTGAAQTVKATAYNNLILSGSGSKAMAAGTSVTGNVSIAPTGTSTASIAAGSTLPVNSLTLGGAGQTLTGTWGSTTSAASHTNNTYFAATTGMLNVANPDGRVTPVITFTLPLPSPTYLGADFSVPATTSNPSGVALTYSVVSGQCVLVSGSTFHASGAGSCMVQAYAAATGSTFANSATQSITIAKANQATVTVSADPTIAVQGFTSQLSGSGGSGTGAFTFAAGSSTGCTVNTSTGVVTINNASAGYTCQVSVTRGSDTNYNASAASAPVTITMAPFLSGVTKAFSSGSDAVAPNSVVQLTISVQNSDTTYQITNESWTDNLIGVQPGIYLVNPGSGVVVANTCGYTVDTAAPGGSTITVQGGTVPIQVGNTAGHCELTVNVSSVTPGNLINTIKAGAMTGSINGQLVANNTPASATLLVTTITPPSLSKTFAPNTIWAGDKSLLTIFITNNDPSALTQMSLTDQLPIDVIIANPANALLTNCGSSSSVTATPGATSVSLNNATLPAGSGSVCSIQVNVTSSDQGSYTNTIPAGAISTYEGVTNAQAAAAMLNVQQLNLTKGFNPASILAGTTSTATITFQNPSNTAYTHAGLIDSMPSGLTVTGTPTTSCAGGTFDTSDNTKLNLLQFATIPVGTSGNPGTCTVTFTVLADANLATLTKINTITAGSLKDDQGISNPTNVSASLSVNAALGLSKSFVAPTTIVAGGSATVSIILNNYTSSAFSNNVTVNDPLPNHLTYNDSATSGTCGGSFGYNSTTNTVSYTGGTIPAGTGTTNNPGTCTLSFVVTNTDKVAGTYKNTIPVGGFCVNSGAICSTAAAASGNLTVNASGAHATGSKAFAPGTILPGQNSLLTISVTAPLDQSLSSVVITDHLPTGMTVSNLNNSGTTIPPSAGADCLGSGTLDAVAGHNYITWTGPANPTVGIAAGTTCSLTVWVTTVEAGSYLNTIAASTDVTDYEGRTLSGDLTATLQVTGLTMSKAFYPTLLAPGGYSLLTITLTNTSSLDVENLSVTDALSTMGGAPNNVLVAPTVQAANARTTCHNAGGAEVLKATPGGNQITLAYGTIPAKTGGINGTCTISVNVQAMGSDTTLRTNTILTTNVTGNVSGLGGNISPTAAATASLQVTPLTLTINKSFSPTYIHKGSVSTLSIKINNPNSIPLNGISFTDNMLDSGTGYSILLANPTLLSVGDCKRDPNLTLPVPIAITGNPGDNHFSFSNIYLAADSSCTITASTYHTFSGSLTNTILAGTVTSSNGAATTQDVVASLQNLPGLGLQKGFLPATIALNGASTLTITLENAGGSNLIDIGLTDALPAHITATGSPSTTCGGPVTYESSKNTITLATGNLATDATCTITVPVTSDTYGCKTNTIPANSMTYSGGSLSNDPASAQLCVQASPSLATTPNPASATIGTRLQDTATLTGGSDSPAPTGSVTFKLYSPSDSKCYLTPEYTEVVPLTGASATTSKGDVASIIGTWNWTADYPGDSNNNPASSGCSAEPVIVKASPGITTTASPTTGTVGIVLKDTANLTGGNSPTGTVTFNLYPPSDATCSLTPSYTEGPINLNGSSAATATGFASNAVGTWHWVAVYNGDGNNDSVNSKCPDEPVTMNPVTSADLSIIKTDGVTSYSAGASVTYTITVTNVGKVDVPGATVADTKPENILNWVWACRPVDIARGCEPAPSGTTDFSNKVNLPVGSSIVYTVTANIVVNPTGDLVNTATVTLPDGYTDATPGNNTSTDTDKILADLTITKTDGVTTYTAGGTTTYKVTIFNGGQVDVIGATVTDPKPANILDWVWACGPVDKASGCTPAASGTADFSNTVDLQVGGSIVYIVTANIVANPTGALVNTATVTLPDIYIDPNGNSVSSTDTDTLAADLSITKTDGVTSYSAGGIVTYTITVTNVGKVDVPGAMVTDPKPANILNWAWECTSSNGGASGCTPAASGTADFSNNVDLPVGGSIIYTVTAKIVASPTGDLINTATVTMPDGYSDLAPGNNTATDTDTRYVQASSLPGTGFAPNQVTKLARQTTNYADLGDLWLEIPRLGVKIPIVGVPELNGTWDVSWLGSQAGWLNGTAYPTSAGDSILTGHVYDAFGQPGPFVHLNGLWYGDQIIIHEGGSQFVYEVREVMQVAPNAVSSVIKHEDLPWVTLITCRGYDEASNSYKYRVAVRAVLVKVK